MEKNMSIKSIIYASVGTVVIAVGAAAIVFPLLPHPGIESGKPPLAIRASQQAVIEARKKTFIVPIYDAIRKDNLAAVQSIWKSFMASSAFEEDPMLRLEMARYLEKKGVTREAHDHLDKILNPPPGYSSTLQHSGEVMSLWLKTAGGESKAKLNQVQMSWNQAAMPMAHSDSGSGDPTGVAKVEYMAAQELEAQTKPKDALAHYERAVQLQPGSSFLWSALGQARTRDGNFAGAKDAMAHAYWTAPSEERAKIKLFNRLSDADLNRSKP